MIDVRLITILAVLAFATTTEAGRPGKTCAKVCSRASTCKIMSFDLCMNFCGQQGAEDTPAKRAKNLALAKLSCSALANEIAPSQWLCTAEGASSYGYEMGADEADVQGTQGIFMLGTGKTRSAAEYKAISECNSILTAQLSIHQETFDDTQGGMEAAVTARCHIKECVAPAPARKQRQR
jgi:hypothetical protein